MADEKTTETPEAHRPPTKREQRVAKRHAVASKRSPRSPEERQADRDAERARKAKVRRAWRARVKGKRIQAGPKASPEDVAQLHAEKPPARPKVRRGVVVSDKADKTITVRIDVARRHRRYEKIVRHSSTLHAHDETNDAHEGDTVQVVESRPISRTKRWRLDEVLERAR
jgi:small subunit ribosomal protein S17